LPKPRFRHTITFVASAQDTISLRSPAIEDYAKAIYALELRSGQTVSTTALADRLGVTPASASGMVKRMCELGLVAHEPYHGVSLTEPGRRVALEVIVTIGRSSCTSSRASGFRGIGFTRRRRSSNTCCRRSWRS
jgi:Iron dependent repressor, N-terminal DNA binding domain